MVPDKNLGLPHSLPGRKRGYCLKWNMESRYTIALGSGPNATDFTGRDLRKLPGTEDCPCGQNVAGI